MKEATDLKMEKAYLAGMLQRNGYPAAFIKALSIDVTPRELDRENGLTVQQRQLVWGAQLLDHTQPEVERRAHTQHYVNYIC